MFVLTKLCNVQLALSQEMPLDCNNSRFHYFYTDRVFSSFHHRCFHEANLYLQKFIIMQL